jgi:iron complex transport system substrate-binding protein
MIAAFRPIFLFLSCALIFSGCGRKKPDPGNSPETLIRVSDFRGKELLLHKPAVRIVCLIESSLSQLYMLQADAQIIGIPADVYRGNAASVYAAMDRRIASKTLPAPGNWDFVNLEQVVSLQPDLVILWASQTESIDRLEQFNLPVYAVMLHSFADVCKEMIDLGKLTGKPERAGSLVDLAQKRLSARRSNPQAPVKAYFMWAQGIGETSGTSSTVNELLVAAGAINACPLEQEHVVVNLEKVIDWDPDVIVMWYNDRLDPQDLLDNPLLKGISAVQHHRVFEFPSAFDCDLWTLKMLYAIDLVTSWCYPEPVSVGELQQARKSLFNILYGRDVAPLHP